MHENAKKQITNLVFRSEAGQIPTWRTHVFVSQRDHEYSPHKFTSRSSFAIQQTDLPLLPAEFPTNATRKQLTHINVFVYM